MKIIFSPEYSGNVYVKPSNGKEVMMDTVVTNTIGLVNLLELRLGLHYEDVPEQERVAHYYDAVCKYMEAHPKNVMAASFKTVGLSTAKAMLSWREELRGADWDFKGKDISERLAVLIGVEEYSKQDGCDMADRLHIVTDQLASQKLDCKDMIIEMAVAKDLLKPTTKALIEVLELHGAKIEQVAGVSGTENNLGKVRQLIASKEKRKITLNKNDDSIQIWKFADDRNACEYLSYNNMEDVDVWINADNKQMDNWLMLMNKALTGSVTADCTPQLTQLFVMGLGMFANPLNVNTLIEWLNMPVHPIDKFFRSTLADCIVTEGGYRNEACKKKIDQFIEGKFVYLNDKQKALPEDKQEEIRLKDKEERQKQVSVFLPSLERSNTINTEVVKQFVIELSSWARQRAHLMAGEADNEQWVEQLMTVSVMCDAFHILLGTVNTDTIDYKTIDSWMSTVYEKGAYTNAIAERGCRTVVDSPAKIASVVNKTVWMGVDGDANQGQECAFLYPSEKAELVKQKYMHPWTEDAENNYHEQVMMTPLRMTSGQLILVVRERIGGEQTLKHPLIVRLEQQIENIEDFVVRPSIGEENRHEVKTVENGGVAAELHFDNSDKIQWPDHLSPTSISTLAEYPFDYMMEHLLVITNDGKAKMADARTTKGNVAHAVIEELFAPREKKRYSTPEEIETRIQNEYEEVYLKVLEAKGAILQLAENKLAEKLFNEQLRSCLNTLLEILKENELKVTGCESYVECQMDLGLPKAIDKEGNIKNRDMVGTIDMTLEDKNGYPVVFDFKWTSWAKGYQDKLSENRSVQLELYRMMLGREKKDKEKRVAYFLMPEARLYSQEEFKDRNCHQLTPANRDNIVEQLKQSAKYRMKQIKSGVVETNGLFEELKYVKDTEAKGLFPLKKNEKDGKKEGYFFSKYVLLTTKAE